MRSDVWDVGKSHLWRLPDIAEPPPRYESSGRVCVLWPLFHRGDASAIQIRHGSLVHHCLRAAIWSRASFLRWTDAVSQGVDFKFYLDSRCLEVVAPIFAANFVDVERDVIVFDTTPTRGVPDTFWGPKLQVFSDSRYVLYL